jgi:cell division protein FtsQ
MTSYHRRRDAERVSMGSSNLPTRTVVSSSSSQRSEVSRAPHTSTPSHGRVASSTSHSTTHAQNKHAQRTQTHSAHSQRGVRTVRSASHDEVRSVHSSRSAQSSDSDHSRQTESSPRLQLTRRKKRVLRGFGDARALSAPKPVMQQLEQSARSGQGFFDNRSDTETETQADQHSGASRVKKWVISLLIVLAAICLIALCVWIFFFSPVFAFHSSDVQIRGGSQWIDRSRVWSVVADQTGLPQTNNSSQNIGRSEFAFSSSNLEHELKSVQAIKSVTVEKKLPHGLLVTIHPRIAQAQLVDQSGAQNVVDEQGVVLSSTSQRINSLPLIHVSSLVQSPQDRAVQQALTVLSHIPTALRGTLSNVSAMTQDSVTTVTGSGISIMWGDASQMKLKGEIVQHILIDKGLMNGKKTIDVSAPLRPIVR